jgi:DNA-binding LacI/PurR family transcriptional regulator
MLDQTFTVGYYLFMKSATPRNLQSFRDSLATNRQRLVAERVVALLEEAGEKGGYLPAERDLAELVGVSRPTLRTVLKQMREAGLIELQGRGRIQSIKVPGGLPRDASQNVEKTAVAVVVAQPAVATDVSQLRHSGFSLHVHHGVMDALHASNDDAFMFRSESLQGRAPDYFRRIGVHGVIVLPGRDDTLRELLEKTHESGISAVVWGEEPWSSRLDHVASDHSLGAYALTRGLLSLGCRRVLRYWVRDLQPQPIWLEQRDQGYERAMREAGLPALPALQATALIGPHFDVIDSKEKFDTYVRLAVGYLVDQLKGPKPVDAIMAPDDHAVIWLTAACRALGRTPGVDIHIVGYDNCADDTQHWQFEPTYPTLTVDKKNMMIGWELVSLLKDRQAGKLPSDPQVRRIPSEIVIPAQQRRVSVEAYLKEIEKA